MKWLIGSALLLVIPPAFGGCSDTTPTRFFRVRFANCTVPSDVKVKINGRKMTLTHPNPDFYEGTVDSTSPIDTKTDIVIAVPAGAILCCRESKEVRKEDSRDCVVEFTASCDTAQWGLLARSDPTITFRFKVDHPDELEGSACRQEREAPNNILSGIGALDTVVLEVERDNIGLVDVRVKLADLMTGSLSLTRARLVQQIDDDAAQSARSGSPQAAQINKMKKERLPAQVVIERR